MQHICVAKDWLEEQLCDRAVAQSLNGGGCSKDVAEASGVVDAQEADDLLERMPSFTLEAFNEGRSVQSSDGCNRPTDRGARCFTRFDAHRANFVTQRSSSYQGRTTKRPSGRRTPLDWGPDSIADAGKSSAVRRPSELAAPPPSESTLVRVGSSSGGSSWACQSLQRRSCLGQDPGRTEGPSCVLATITDLLEEAGGRTVNSEGSALFSPRRRTQLGMWSWGPSGKLSSDCSGKWVPRFHSRGFGPSVHSRYRRGYHADAAAGTRSSCSLWSPPEGTWWWPTSSRSWECERLQRVHSHKPRCYLTGVSRSPGARPRPSFFSGHGPPTQRGSRLLLRVCDKGSLNLVADRVGGIQKPSGSMTFITFAFSR